MQDEKTVQRFIELRAGGWTYARLVAELTVSKPTLIARSPKFQYQIQTGGLPPQNRIPVKKR